jgi:hypothetical protein
LLKGITWIERWIARIKWKDRDLMIVTEYENGRMTRKYYVRDTQNYINYTK